MVPLPPGELILFDAQNGSTLTVPSGELLVVRLTAQPSSGFGWRITAGPPGVVFLGQSYDANRPMPGDNRPPAPAGQPGQQVLRLRVQGRPGQTVRLALAYTRAHARLTLARVYRVRLRIAPARS